MKKEKPGNKANAKKYEKSQYQNKHTAPLSGVVSLELEKPRKGKLIRAKRKAKKPNAKDLPLYHALEIGAGFDLNTGRSQPMTLYINDELWKASEEERMRRMAKTKKLLKT